MPITHTNSGRSIENGALGTYFSGTSTDTATMQVRVELFDAAGGAPFNDAAATSLSVGPGATVIFGTNWGKLLGDTAVAALLDRLLHNALILKCGPRSWRTKTSADLRTEGSAA